MEMAKLKWDEERQGYVRSVCGAFYERPNGWKSPVNWCMKCKMDIVMED